MEVFLLEDDDYGDMFIMQSSFNSNKDDSSATNNEILGDGSDFARPCASLVSQGNITSSANSDISDAEDSIFHHRRLIHWQ